jgi:hypothetical protein
VATSTNAVFTDGQQDWHHIVGTIEQTDVNSARASIYFDGVLVGTGVNLPGNIVTMSEFMGIATFIGDVASDEEFDATKAYDGLVDDLRLYNIALSPVQIRRLYRQGLAGKSYDWLPVKDTKIVTIN